MVIFKGNKRIFDKIISEDSTSTAGVRNITIYGVTSYTDLEDVLIQINSSETGIEQSTLNINNLGPVALKILDNDGNMIDVKNNWSIPNQVYSVVYKEEFFLLVTQNQDSSEEKKTYIIETIDSLIALTSSSSQQDIETAFNNDTGTFIISLKEGALLIAQNTTSLVYINYKLNYTGTDLNSIILEFIYNNNYYKQTYTINTLTGEIASVNTEISDLLLRNINNTNF